MPLASTSRSCERTADTLCCARAEASDAWSGVMARRPRERTQRIQLTRLNDRDDTRRRPTHHRSQLVPRGNLEQKKRVRLDHRAAARNSHGGFVTGMSQRVEQRTQLALGGVRAREDGGDFGIELIECALQRRQSSPR